MTSPIASVSLYFTEGSSDKVYSAQLESKDMGFVVNFQYGRRGSSLKADTKTPEPVTRDKAQKIFDKLIQEKKAKGYTEATSGERYQDTTLANRVTGVVPQLLNPISEDELQDYVQAADWGMQQKYDGERRLILIEPEGITGTNRDGLSIALSASFEQAMKALQAHADLTAQTVLDGEDLGEKGYAVFDVLEYNGVCYRHKPYAERLAQLEALLEHAPTLIIRPTTAHTPKQKAALLERLRESNQEGVVFKQMSAKWHGGRPASGGSALKFKFVESATLIAKKGREGKRSVSLWARDENHQEVAVGNVSIPANHPLPKVGEIIEVEYLYAYEGGSLYQPIFKSVRTDKTEADLTTSFKYKPK